MHVLLGSQTLGGAYSPGPQHDRPDGRAHRPAVQRGRRPADPERGQLRRPAALAARRSDLQRRQRPASKATTCSRSSGCPTSSREQYLQRVREMATAAPATPRAAARSSSKATPRPTIAKNASAARACWRRRAWPRRRDRRRPGWATRSPSRTRRPPSSAAQSGSNLLMVGQQDEAALAILAAALISLAAQHAQPAPAAQFYVLDGTPGRQPARPAYLAGVAAGAAASGTSRRLARRAGRCWPSWPPRSSAGRRRATPTRPPLYLFVYGLQRFRDLRKAEDDFSFGRRGEEQAASPRKQFGDILRDGPAVGIHMLVWCDTLNNLNAHARPAGAARVRDARAVPDERRRFEQPDRLAAGEQAGPPGMFPSEEQGAGEVPAV